jgi:aspartate racemase
MAGTLLHQAIIRNTPDVRTDADHLDIVHLSLSSSLPDRTAFLMGRELRNPGPVMAKAIVAASTQLALAGRRWLAALPCCTFHTPAIFDAFLDDLDGAPGLARVVHLVDETVAHLLAHSARPKRIGVLSTEGSHRMGLWRDPLRAAGFDVYDMTAQEAGAFHAVIYDPGFGLKATFPPSPRACTEVVAACGKMMEAGVEALVLGCTELSMVADLVERQIGADIVVCDPVDVQARACVAAAFGGEAAATGQGRTLAVA